MNYITPYENVLLKKLKARQKRDIGARQKNDSWSFRFCRKQRRIIPI